jgi:hypothetical protein
VPDVPQQPDPPVIELKDPAFAALLAWLIPGLGHMYQGRWAKGILFFVCILGLFAFGLHVGGSNQPCLDGRGKIGWGRAVYFSWTKEDRRLPYLCQIGVGLPALPALIQANWMNNHRKVLLGGFMAPPRPTIVNDSDPNVNQPTAHDLNKRLARYFVLATCLTMVAGLLNVLAIYDACAGPVLARPAKPEEEENDEKEEAEKEETA